MSSILPASHLAFADESAAAASTPGVWQKHEYTFAFVGFTTTYSCTGLADKLRVLLLAAGARKDAKTRPGACAGGFGQPDKFARAYLTFYSLTPHHSSPIGASWRPVSISDRHPRDISVGDCELVEQFRDKILPLLTTRNLDSHITCVPHQNSGSRIDLKFESFQGTAAGAT